MSLNLNEKKDGKILELRISGKLLDSDFHRLEPEFYKLVRDHGKIRVLVLMLRFHGWEGAALWDEIKFDLKHLSEIERLAIVGDKKWERFLTLFCRPFTGAEVRYFDRTALHKARAWLERDAA